MRSVRMNTDWTRSSVSKASYWPSPGVGSVKLHFTTPRNGQAYARTRNRSSGAINSAAPILSERTPLISDHRCRSGGDDLGVLVERRAVVLGVPLHVERD